MVACCWFVELLICLSECSTTKKNALYNYLLDIACDSIQSAINAQQGGADRIELCENLAQGGVTPSAAKIKLAKAKLNVPVFVLIRPRKGDFLYSQLELETMLESIQIA